MSEIKTKYNLPYKFLFDSKFSNLLIRFYASFLMPLGFPPPRPIIINFEKIQDYQDLTKITGKMYPRFDFLGKCVYKFFIFINFKAPIILSPISFNWIADNLKIDPDLSKILKIHQERFYGLRVCSDISYLLISIPILTILSIYIFYILSSNFLIINISGNGYLLKTLYYFSYLIVYAVPTLLLLRILFTITKNIAAETLCIQEILYILLELQDEFALHKPDRRYMLTRRMQYLSNVTQFIPKAYILKYNPETQDWIHNHFNKISQFIDERQKWIMAPQESTFKELKKDMIWLSEIYISGMYGEFSWSICNINRKQSRKKSSLQTILTVLTRTIGIGIPLIIMGLYIFLPNKLHSALFSSISVSKDNVAYLFLAWLLITIDISLKLGFVKTLVEVAKGLKDIVK